MPLFKAWSSDRRKRKAVLAEDYDEFVSQENQTEMSASASKGLALFGRALQVMRAQKRGTGCLLPLVSQARTFQYEPYHYPFGGYCNVEAYTPPHPISQNTYRLWSLVSKINQGFLKMNDDASPTLKFDGVIGDKAELVNIKAVEVGTSGVQRLFRLQFSDGKNKQMIVGEKQNDQLNVDLQPVPADVSQTPNEAKFEAHYYYAFTMLRCFSVDGETDLYLASNEKGNPILVRGGIIRYPNPGTLFIPNQVI